MNKFFHRNYSLYLGVISVSIVLFFTAFGPQMAPHSIFTALEVKYINGAVVSPPLKPFESMEYPLGTDTWGYDLLSMILYGLRYTVWIAIAVAAIKMVIGTVIGLYIGTWKKTPSFIIAFESAWSYVPAFLILYFCLLPISFGAVLEPPFLITYFIVIASIVGTPSIISSVRQKTAEVYKKDFVLASITLGAKKQRLLWHHVFPQLKESLLVMFMMEIVYVITLMGQLALLHIFIGGTIVRYDPLIYLSVTKELSGLVGQARDNLMGNQYILIVPLIVLLITTISFSLLTTGLKNKFQSDYARMPWIKTGIIPKGKPSRKKFGEKRFLNLDGNKIAFIALCFLFILGGIFVYQMSDSKVGVEHENKAAYDINLSMEEEGSFKVTEDVIVTNKSGDNWKEIQFYIPKQMEHIQLDQLFVNGTEVSYTEKNGVYLIELPNKWQEERRFNVQFNYTMVAEENTDIFQDWYFAVSPYRDGKWSEATKDNPYIHRNHALQSSFAVSYNLQPSYTFITSGVENGDNKVSMKNGANFSFSITHNEWQEKEVVTKKGTKIRFLRQQAQGDLSEKDFLAVIDYFEEWLTTLPYKQVDIVVSENEKTDSVPGMIILNANDIREHFVFAKQVAALYFASSIIQDPKNDSWIGSGMSYLAAYQYSVDKGKESKQDSIAYIQTELNEMEEHVKGRQVSNSDINEINHVGVLAAQPAWSIIELINEQYRYKGTNPEEVGKKYLASLYEQFSGKEIDSENFLQFTRDFFRVPSGAFNRWLNTEASRE